MKFIRIILFPLVPIYYLVTWIRNYLYDKGWLESKSYDLPVVCVGNLSTGGTGKTPMIEYLTRLFKDDYLVAILSRGYKRKTEGFVLADSNSDSKTIGDEPYQFYLKFPDIRVAVDSDRQNGIAQLLKQKPSPKLILLDDAFQHRKVNSGFNILLTSYHNPYNKDFVLPTGNLREPRSGAKRADVIVVTKCPEDLNEDQKRRISAQLKPNPEQQVFFSHIAYPSFVKSLENDLEINRLPKFTLVTGIANPKPLKDYLIENKLEFDHLEYPDHHSFKPSDIEVLAGKELIVTTEKDFVRLKGIKALNDKLYYLPISFEIDRADAFRELLHTFLTEVT